jgi:probable F420-dependent oxidoreductase
MHIGIISNCTDRSVDAGTQARLVEQAGLESLVFGEHSHIPAARETPYPGGNGDLPPGYERTLDLFVVLTAAALASTTVKIGTGICQVVQRDPILTAKAIASVDHISGGRMLLVTGSSWNIQEMRNHGTDPDTRYELLEERVLAMREIWKEDVATFHGNFVNFDRIWSWPKPVQSPLPIFIGGNSEGSEARAQRIGTGWAPLDAPGIAERIRAYLDDANELGVETTVTAVAGELSAQRIEEYAQAGAERWLHHIPLDLAASEDVFVAELERLNSVHGEFAGTP